MARVGHDHIGPSRQPGDGAVRCALCADASPMADHAWCSTAGALVCGECCAALLGGDVRRFLSIVANTGRLVTPESLFRSCSECERGRRTFETAVDDGLFDDAPAC